MNTNIKFGADCTAELKNHPIEPYTDNGRVMSRGFAKKGDMITFMGHQYEALTDCRYMKEESEMVEISMFNVFAKSEVGNIYLFSLGVEAYEDGRPAIDEARWFPGDSWDEGKPPKEIIQLANDSGIELYWNEETECTEIVK